MDSRGDQHRFNRSFFEFSIPPAKFRTIQLYRAVSTDEMDVLE